MFFKQNVLRSINRRSFLLRAGLLTTGITLNACLRKISPGDSDYSHIKGELKGPNSTAGHILRDKVHVPSPSSARRVKTLIVGGGISGLSAARWLKKHGHTDFELLDLEKHVGGNAGFRQNEVSAYPLGAHYIPIPNNEDAELLSFLEEHGIISHYVDGLPFYNEFDLCFAPEERLLINGQWQDGLVPEFGIADEDRKQIKSFFELCESLKTEKGTDGKYAFDIPVAKSSKDIAYRKLDVISFKSYLQEKGFTSPYLLWYLDYCCKDDYGQKSNAVSAWAGLNYFAARRGRAANADSSTVLTWPEGNGRLMSHLASTVKNHIRTGEMAYSITEEAGGGFAVHAVDLKTQSSHTIHAKQLIMACPQYVNQKLLSGLQHRAVDYGKFSYAPWLVANITLKVMPHTKGAGLCWDNVAYNTASVGYVNAGQQSLKTMEDKKVFTYYLPLCDHEPRVSRLAAYARTYEQWLDIILPEMEYMHPNITENIEHVELWLWGHGMICPTPGFISGSDRMNASKPLNGRIFFAHSDLSGISIFEEAFHQGIRAAKEILSANSREN
ncbi:MAG: FAD-dependent oxidoreductase [Arcticibacter sp.]